MTVRRYRRVAVNLVLIGVLFGTVACENIFNLRFNKSFVSPTKSIQSENETFHLVKDSSEESSQKTENIDPLTLNVDYKDFCTTANLYTATKGYKQRYAYGLTFECLFFFFNIEDYPAVEILFDYINYRYDIVSTKVKKVCPSDLFEIKYIARFPKPYFEVLDLKAGTTTQLDVKKSNFFFYHYTPSSLHSDWEAPRNRWTSHYHSLLLHHLSFNNSKSGRGQVHYYIRHNNEAHPGACFAETHGSTALLFQVRLVLGTEAIDLNSFMEDGQFPEQTIKVASNYYFWGIIGEIILSGITIIICLITIIIKVCQYYKFENYRSEVEKFIASCYVKKLEKLSKLVKTKKHKTLKVQKIKKTTPKKRKKKSDPSSSRHHYKKWQSESEKIPDGSKIIPLPLEKDLFASDKPSVKALPKNVEKNLTLAKKESGNGSLCSLKSITGPVDNSLDWTSKGVKLSNRPIAIEMYKKALEKDEDEAYNLGINVSTLRRKRKLKKNESSLDFKPNLQHTGDGLVNNTMNKTLSNDLKDTKKEDDQPDKAQRVKATAATNLT